MERQKTLSRLAIWNSYAYCILITLKIETTSPFVFLRSNGQASSIPSSSEDCVTFLLRHDHPTLVSMFVGDLAEKEKCPLHFLNGFAESGF